MTGSQSFTVNLSVHKKVPATENKEEREGGEEREGERKRGEGEGR